jgi:uncharacterized protein YggE
MNSRSKWITVFLLAVLMIGLVSAGFWGSDTSEVQQKNVITVSGYGTVDTHPDEAVLRLAVLTQAKDAKNASDENVEKMDAVLGALYEIGISKDDAVTSGYQVWPQYSWRDEEQRLTGFQVRNSLTVTVRDIENIGDVIDAALFAGANEINDVTFTVSDDRQAELKSEAIADAVKKAKADAASVAKAMDVTIVGPVEISTTGSQFSPYRMYMGYETVYDAAMPVPEVVMAAGTQIQPGDVTVSAQVTVVYEFRMNA